MFAGRIPACKWVVLACQRHLNDLLKARKADYPYRFDEAKAARVCRFIELLPHTKGEWARTAERMRLQPWQQFILCTLFGWLEKDSGFRRFKKAYICVPRKNGKSILGSGIGNYMFAADGEFGAEVYSGATTEKQAWEVFRPARQQVERTPSLRTQFGIQVNAKGMVRLKDASRFEPIIGNPGDGASPSCAIVDEYHEHQTNELYDTMETGMGARRQPLMLVITTAGSNIAGPCHAMQSELQKVLEGAKEEENFFGLVYTVDPEDDWTTGAALKKANPNYGVSVYPKFLETQQAEAIANSRAQNRFKTKHLNIWVNAATAWMNMQWWLALGDDKLKPEQFEGEPCVISLDVASKIDITASIKIFSRKIGDTRHYYVFPKFWLPEDRAMEPEAQHYQSWVHDGFLKTTSENMLDYAVVQADVSKDIIDYRISEFCFDPWNAAQLAQQIQAETFVTAVEVRQTVEKLSEPMKWLEALVKAKRIHHDNNPVMNWMMSNVVAKIDAKENIFPRKEKPENKIDGPVALITVLSRAIVNEGNVIPQVFFF